MNILVIGGAGYIGSHVVRELLDQGYAVTVFDNLSSGLRENLFPDARFVYGDILDYVSLARTIAKGFDALVHLAAFKAAGESMIEPEKYSLNNISGTVNILNAASEKGINHIVFSSSAAVYGEPRYVPIDEKHPKDPANYYGFTKLEIERFLGWYEKLRSIRYASLRYFNVAGYDVEGRVTGKELNPANLIPIIMETASGVRTEVQVFGNDYETPDGTCVRDYIHVNDLADAHVKALDYISKEGKSLTVNLGTGNGASVFEVIETARKITGKSIQTKIAGRRAGDPAKLTASASFALETLGWEAKYSDMETIIKTSWEIYGESK
jgi:UDP-glucose 4-epimerase